MLGMRKDLRSSMGIQVAKKRLMRRAWKESGLVDEDLEILFDGAVQPAIISAANMNSFDLFKELKKTQYRSNKPKQVQVELEDRQTILMQTNKVL